MEFVCMKMTADGIEENSGSVRFLWKEPLAETSECKNEQLHLGVTDLQTLVSVGVSARKSAGKTLDFILTPQLSPRLAWFMKDLAKLI